MIVNANGNVEARLNLTLLWTNSSPTSSFKSQDITLDLSNYTILYVMYMPSTSIQYPITATVQVTSSDIGSRRLMYNFSDDAYYRTVTARSDLGYVQFGSGVLYTVSGSEQSSGTDDSVVIPYCIYGS